MIGGDGGSASRGPFTGSNPGDGADGPAPIARDHADLADRLLADLRLTAFRSYLRSTVTRMSALIPDVLRTEGVEIDWMIHALRASGTWSAAASANPGDAACDRTVAPDGGGAAPSMRARHDGSASIVRDRPGRSRIGIEVVGGRLELRVESKACVLSTIAGLGQITLTSRLPEALAMACEGRTVDDVVDHDLLRGRGFAVVGVIQHDAASTILFTVGELPVEFPDFGMEEGDDHDLG